MQKFAQVDACFSGAKFARANALSTHFGYALGNDFEGGKAPFGIGGKGSLPHFHVGYWAAKGGIVDEATLIGAGEAGAEAIVPLDPFWKRLDEDLGRSRIDYDLMAMAFIRALEETDTTTRLYCDGREIARATAPFIKTETDAITRRNNRRLGYA